MILIDYSACNRRTILFPYIKVIQEYRHDTAYLERKKNEYPFTCLQKKNAEYTKLSYCKTRASWA